MYQSESNSYQLYSQNELLNTKQDDISSIEELANVNEDLHALLTENAVTAKTNTINNLLLMTCLSISIVGCLTYLLKQRKKHNL